MSTNNTISALVGQTLTDIEGCEKASERIMFKAEGGKSYLMFHEQDCCESVTVEDVCGDVSDLIGSPITQAEESANDNEDPPGVPKHDGGRESFTWTFYRLSTAKGQVVIRWYGSSNGYYSERVSFVEAA